MQERLTLLSTQPHLMWRETECRRVTMRKRYITRETNREKYSRRVMERNILGAEEM